MDLTFAILVEDEEILISQWRDKIEEVSLAAQPTALELQSYHKFIREKEGTLMGLKKAKKIAILAIYLPSMIALVAVWSSGRHSLAALGYTFAAAGLLVGYWIAQLWAT